MCLGWQVIQEVFCWTRNFTEVRRLARRKEQLYCQLLGNQQPMLALGLPDLLSSLSKNQVSHLHVMALSPLGPYGRSWADGHQALAFW